MFDCIMPTRNGRNGQLFTKEGIMNMRNERWKNDFSPLEEEGESFVDRLYSKAYLRHLINTNEILGLQIASIHNLAFYVWLAKEARKQIIAGNFTDWKTRMIEKVTRRL
jgi:queuine tRNA-ribosyltransferase